jgi:hypothetical protein
MGRVNLKFNDSTATGTTSRSLVQDKEYSCGFVYVKCIPILEGRSELIDVK